MTTLSLLRRARQRISGQWDWTQFARARDRFKLPCEPDDPRATKWSADGALDAEDASHELRFAARVALNRHHRAGLLMFFNDNHTQAEVLALFDAAIADLEGQRGVRRLGGATAGKGEKRGRSHAGRGSAPQLPFAGGGA